MRETGRGGGGWGGLDHDNGTDWLPDFFSGADWLLDLFSGADWLLDRWC